MRRRILVRIFLLDLASLVVGFVAASVYTFGVVFPWTAGIQFLRPGQSIVPLLATMVGGLALGSFVSSRSWGSGMPRPTYGRAVSNVTAMVVVVALAEFFVRDQFYYSRTYVAAAAVVTFGAALLHRAIARARPWNEPVALITHEKQLVEDLHGAPHITVVEVLDPESQGPSGPLPHGTTLALDLRAVLSDQMAQFISSSNLAGFRIRPLVDVYEEHTGRLAIVHLAEGWELQTPVQASKTFQSAKRVVDATLTVLAAPLALVLGVLVWVAVRLDSKGPAIFRQIRVGRGGRHFTLYKFRTMINGADDGGAQFATIGDPRLTSVGRVLRKVRMDELPQLWNVLKGDLSLVGPRPEQPIFVEQFSRSIPFYDHRHLIRPGLTGWAQVSYGYADDEADTIEKLTYDLYYVKHMSPWLDLNIFGRSVWTVLSGFGAR
ncbi:MAG TPA: sugar transferase [Acidimicrobiia bacterium]|nr:sugar transferase [Acidimicrobiia bacterium]